MLASRYRASKIRPHRPQSMGYEAAVEMRTRPHRRSRLWGPHWLYPAGASKYRGPRRALCCLGNLAVTPYAGGPGPLSPRIGTAPRANDDHTARPLTVAILLVEPPCHNRGPGSPINCPESEARFFVTNRPPVPTHRAPRRIAKRRIKKAARYQGGLFIYRNGHSCCRVAVAGPTCTASLATLASATNEPTTL